MVRIICIIIFIYGLNLSAEAELWKIEFTFGSSFVSCSDLSDEFPENNFQLIAAHRVNFLQSAIYRQMNKKLFFGLEAKLHLKTEYSLEDTEDNDQVQVEGFPLFSAGAGCQYRFFDLNKLKFYLILSCGYSFILNAKTSIYYSAYGFPVIIEPPEKKSAFYFKAGVQPVFKLSTKISALTAISLQTVFWKTRQQAVNLSAGIVFDL